MRREEEKKYEGKKETTEQKKYDSEKEAPKYDAEMPAKENFAAATL